MSTLRNILLGSKRRRAATLLGMVAVLCVGVLELASQAVAYVQFKGLDKIRDMPENYVQASTVPGLTYELKRGFDFKKPTGEHIRINNLGFREDTDNLYADKRRIAIFGDSVALGVGVTQTDTIPAALQNLIDPQIEHTKVFNCGLLGLGLSEFPPYLQHVLKTYQPHTVVYILNPNDFVLRDSLYEGADGGMYRMFERPLLKSPLVVRKAIYRLKKGGVSPSNGWYRWTFDGTKAANLPKFLELRDLCKSAPNPTRLHVVLMPIRGSFATDDKTITDIYREIENYLTLNNISFSSPVAAFAAAGADGNPQGNKFIDFTDHYTPEGSRIMAAAIKDIVGEK